MVVLVGVFGSLNGKLFVDKYSPSEFTPIVSKSPKVAPVVLNLKPLNPWVGSALFETARRKLFPVDVELLTTSISLANQRFTIGSKKTRGSERPSLAPN